MELYDEQAVLNLNALATTARSQIEDAIKIVDVPVSITGAGSMFRLHFQENPPESYREINQTIEVKTITNELLDYLFFEEHIIMINTMACMFATTLTQDNVDQLSEALLRGLQLVKPKIEQLS